MDESDLNQVYSIEMEQVQNSSEKSPPSYQIGPDGRIIRDVGGVEGDVGMAILSTRDVRLKSMNDPNNFNTDLFWENSYYNEHEMDCCLKAYRCLFSFFKNTAFGYDMTLASFCFLRRLKIPCQRL